MTAEVDDPQLSSAPRWDVNVCLSLSAHADSCRDVWRLVVRRLASGREIRSVAAVCPAWKSGCESDFVIKARVRPVDRSMPAPVCVASHVGWTRVSSALSGETNGAVRGAAIGELEHGQ